MESLTGKTIKSITVFGDYQEQILFETNESDLIFTAVDDCCSTSYFSDIWNSQNIIDHKIERVEKLELIDGYVPYRVDVGKRLVSS